MMTINNKTFFTNKGTSVFVLSLGLSVVSGFGCGRANGDGDLRAGNQVLVGDGTGVVNGKVVGAKGTAMAKSVVALIAKTNVGEALCTATLIDSNTALTAAHCVEGKPERMELVFNRNLTLNSSDKEHRAVDSYAQHPRWHGPDEQGRGDLALVHFVGGLPEGYHAVALAPQNLKLKAGDQVTLLGFGVEDGLRGVGSGVLRTTQTQVLKEMSPTEIVSDGRKTGVCFGDSGGPAFVKHGEKMVQWGVASSVTARNCEQYDIHTSIMSYRAWIKKTATHLQK